MNKYLGILEGLLYVQGDEGLTLGQLTESLSITEEQVASLIQTLKTNYEQEERGLRINYLGNTFKLTTKEEHKEYYRNFLESNNTTLSQAALETLAIIAYNEPITRIQIEELRGVDTSYTIRKLVAKGLIKENGKSDLPGRPILYKTTDDFLDFFGLSTINDLPEITEVEDIEEKDLFLSKYSERNG